MSHIDRKHLIRGILMSIVFIIILAVMFSPVFNGHNAFKAADALFNSIAKGSTYYVESLKTETEEFKGTFIDVSIDIKEARAAENAHKILEEAGASVRRNGEKLSVSGDMGTIISSVLTDADNMFYNRGEKVSEKYGIEEKLALYTWWSVFRQIEDALKDQKKFKQAAFFARVKDRGIEVGYNFYGIQPESITSKIGITIFALVFYVFYTLWWGYAIFFMAEGLGLALTHGSKKEV